MKKLLVSGSIKDPACDRGDAERCSGRAGHEEEARLLVERLRILCVTQRWLLERRDAAHAGVVNNLQGGIRSHLEAYAAEHVALRDALAFFERVTASKTEWTAADVKRLNELRELAK